MPETGSIRARTYTSLAQMPVEGATVAITRRSGSGKMELLSIQVTDNSGNIRGVTVPAPPRIDSTQPFSQEPAFTPYDVWVEHPDYGLTVIEGVQVFPGVESVLQIALNPVIAGESWSSQTQIHPISGQDL